MTAQLFLLLHQCNNIHPGGLHEASYFAQVENIETFKDVTVKEFRNTSHILMQGKEKVCTHTYISASREKQLGDKQSGK